MLFTEGKLRSFERMMREIPKPPKSGEQNKPNKLSDFIIKERNCYYCLYFDSRHKKCKQEKCNLFDD